MTMTRNRGWQLACGVILSSLLVSGCGGSSSDSDNDPETDNELPANVRETSKGLVEGVQESYGLVFRGIPYAQPPVRDLRYADPVPAEPWDDTLMANEFGGSCIQPASTFGASESTEDCLYLNVYTEEGAEGRPVMVWIHGGAFETGSGGASYTPSGLLEHDVVVVTLNYRMGVLGFLSHPDIEGPSGSYGIMDQQLALQWVKDNIASFGGDPENVTIFGESAGGASVWTHIASPAAADLFDKAIIQSGAYIGVVNQPTQEATETKGQDFFFDEFGCETIECIRGLSAQEILAAQEDSGFSYVPSLRSDILPKDVKTVLADNDYNQVPIMTGSNLDEGRLFIGIAELGRIAAARAADPSLTVAQAQEQARLKEAQYRDQIVDQVGEMLADTVMAVYPLSDYGPDGAEDRTSLAVSAINTDARFACPSLPQLDRLIATNENNVYAYEFTDRDAPSIIPPGNTFDLGAAHAFEIQYIFGSRASREARGMNEASLDLADAMTAYWASFATDGDPNSSDGTGVFWENIQANENMLELDPGQIGDLSVDAFSSYHKCAVLWNASPT